VVWDPGVAVAPVDRARHGLKYRTAEVVDREPGYQMPRCRFDVRIHASARAMISPLLEGGTVASMPYIARQAAHMEFAGRDISQVSPPRATTT